MFDVLFVVLEDDYTSFWTRGGEGESVFSFLEGLQVEVRLSDHVWVVEEADDDWLSRIVVAESFLVNFEVIVSVVSSLSGLTLVEKILFFIFYLVEFPLSASLAET